jgi:two-component system sensor histidine kinase KdpD
LAQQLGASVETVYGDDVAYQIAEFSRLSGVTKIVLGRGETSNRILFWKPSMTERLVELTPELDIHIIPDTGTARRFASHYKKELYAPAVPLLDLLKSTLLLVLSTLVGLIFYYLGLSEANIITVYILGVMLTSIFTKSAVCSFLNSVVGVLAFNFFFTEPRFSLHIYASDYMVTFLVMFLASLLTGSLAAKLKSLAKHSAQLAWRTKLLFETNQELQKAGTQDEILSVTARQLLKIFQRDIVTYRSDQGQLDAPKIFPVDDAFSESKYSAASEHQAAQWVLTNNKRAGAGTETFSDACCTYLAVRTAEQVYGVIGVAASGEEMDSFEGGLLLSILGECALAMENQKNLEEKEAAAVLAKNEQLRANLLRSISHDLRTPLTSISGNASNLLSNGDMFDAKTKHQMYVDIYDDAMWLINLVENLLSVSRLEGGQMNLHLSTELIGEVVAEALRHINRRSAEHHLHIQSGDEYLLAQMDAHLIVQVIINIVDNAIKYTPPGSDIEISWERQGRFAALSVADNGPGIPDSAKPRVFDMFYSASNRIADSRRSMGLGLALCKSIITAHGGEITVADHAPHGTVFTFTIPIEEVELHE